MQGSNVLSGEKLSFRKEPVVRALIAQNSALDDLLASFQKLRRIPVLPSFLIRTQIPFCFLKRSQYNSLIMKEKIRSDLRTTAMWALTMTSTYPPNALCPQGQLTGLQMGAKAETLWYIPGFFKKLIKAPWPPMLKKRIFIKPVQPKDTYVVSIN